jgi:hypothetical protein
VCIRGEAGLLVYPLYLWAGLIVYPVGFFFASDPHLVLCELQQHIQLPLVERTQEKTVVAVSQNKSKTVQL